ncbi:MAG: hypothetical protein AAF926_07890, partial [Pseudomonadota bacterium]
MTIFHAPSLADLAHVPNEAAVGLVQRPVPEATDTFFHALTQQPFRLSGMVTLRDMDRDIRRMTDPIVPTELRTHSVYELW